MLHRFNLFADVKHHSLIVLIFSSLHSFPNLPQCKKILTQGSYEAMIYLGNLKKFLYFHDKAVKYSPSLLSHIYRKSSCPGMEILA
jgi:hypothetical protein